MVRTSRVAAPVIVALGISAVALSGASALGLPKIGKAPEAAQGTEPEVRLKAGEWPQARSDLKPDPAIRFGALPNGMRYAIMKNATPAGQASLRLRIDAGSLEESDDQQGLAHFLEHMAFRGSKNVPDGEMVKILERHGLAFGADTNAQTDFDDTTYKLDLPKTDDDTLDTSLMLLREVAGNLTISQDAINQERGVILSEERLRDTPFYRIFKDRLAFFMPGQRPPERFPIGKVDIIQNAKREQLADFYSKYYRPERATLIAVGDFDVDAVEAMIKAKFGDWQGQGAAGADPDLGRVQRRGLQTSLSVQQGGPTTVQMAWMGPPDLGPDDTAQRKRDLIQRLGFEVLNRRLSTLARGDNPPFISAGGFRDSSQFRAASVTILSLTANPDQWQGALSTAEQEQRRLVKFGVRPDELAREIAENEAALKAAAAQAPTRVTPRLADEITATTGQRDVQTSPADDLAFFEAVAKDVTADQVSAAMRQAFQGSGPLISVSSPTGLDGGEKAIQTAYNTAHDKQVTATVAQAALSWPYTDFGAAGKVAEQREVTDLDTVFVRFENGVRLTVKPTKFRDDQVLVKVRIGSGLKGLPPSRQSMAWAGYAFIEGGLKKISANDTERTLASTVYGANYGLEEDANVLSGATRRQDLDTQMQVLAAYASEPGWRPEALQRMKTYTATLLDQYGATDSGVLGRDLPGLMHAGDRRWTFPTRDDISSADLEALKAQMAQITTGPIEVVIVGDVTVDKAIAAVASTFGALPPRDAAAAPAVTPVNFPAPNTQPVVLTHRGRADQALGYAAWRTTDFFADPQGARNVSILGEVMQLRLLDTFRKEQSVTYSPQVGYSSSFVWPGWGYVSASVEVPPSKLPDFFSNVNRIAADLRDHPVSADELERAKKPRIEEAEKSRETNGYWISALSGAQTDPRRLDAIRSELPNMERITAADVQKTAQRYLRDDAQWKLEVTPAGS